ncbi:MAG: GNAT family N-acetyltransferase [Clostridia bacterium]|nr:GNAT family N-acetyltransferase [Clostridia bacterium]
MIREKDESVSYESIQELLHLAHEKNKANGLVYATADQTVAKLIEKISSGVCFIAVTNDGTDEMLVGTCTLEQRTLKYWYIENKEEPLLLLKLVGIHPDWSGKGIGKALIGHCVDFARKNHYKMIVTDSAEENSAFRRLMSGAGFVIVDCVKYASNNFISAVYAKWIFEECPWPENIRAERYLARKKEIVENNENRV